MERERKGRGDERRVPCPLLLVFQTSCDFHRVNTQLACIGLAQYSTCSCTAYQFIQSALIVLTEPTEQCADVWTGKQKPSTQVLSHDKSNSYKTLKEILVSL